MRSSAGPKYLGFVLVTIGVTFAGTGLTFWFAWGFPETAAINQAILGIVVHVLFGYIVVMSGIAIYQSTLSVAECLIAAKWCFGGVGLMSGLVVWGAAPELLAGEITLGFLNQLIVVGAMGAAAGVLIGVNRGQAIQNERLVSEKDEKREMLLFLLRLLRHDVKNDLTAITGYADLLQQKTDLKRDIEPADRIKWRAKSMAQLLETAGTVIESETDRHEFGSIDIEPLLREQILALESTAPEVELESDIEAGLHARADQLVDDLFRNVLDNAVAHNSADDLTVAISAQSVDDEVEVVISDTGSGIPEDIRDDVFEPGVKQQSSSGDGLGLYLVKKLIESYGGSIEVTSTDVGTEITTRFLST